MKNIITTCIVAIFVAALYLNTHDVVSVGDGEHPLFLDRKSGTLYVVDHQRQEIVSVNLPRAERRITKISVK